MEREKESGAPTLTFKNGITSPNNFLCQSFDKNTFIAVSSTPMLGKLKTSSVSAFIFLKVAELCKNPTDAWSLYFDRDDELRPFSFKRLDAELMQDLAIYAFVKD